MAVEDGIVEDGVPVGRGAPIEQDVDAVVSLAVE